MMNVPFIFRSSSILVCVLTATSGLSQELPSIPPGFDPTFWGRANSPYSLRLTQTTTTFDGNGTAETHVSEANVYRDAAGRVCTQAFYENGKPSVVSIRDPGRSTMTSMRVFDKSAWVMPVPQPAIQSIRKDWTVERLPSRVIAGIPADGIRFTRIVPASADGKRAQELTVEEDWISSTLGVVLQQKTESQSTGTIVRTVSNLKQVEPDPALFSVPSEYSMQQPRPAAR